MKDIFIPMKEALKELGICSRQLYNLRVAGKIRFTKVNARVFYYSLADIRKTIKPVAIKK